MKHEIVRCDVCDKPFEIGHGQRFGVVASDYLCLDCLNWFDEIDKIVVGCFSNVLYIDNPGKDIYFVWREHEGC
jgi:hypothetical protein